MSESSTSQYDTLQPLRQSPSLNIAQQQQFTTVTREARLHSPWKRSACDRCRSHKLKCQRETNDTSQSCVRCTRAREVCFTSSAKSPAYPAQSQNRSRLVSPSSVTIDREGNAWNRGDSQSAAPVMRSENNDVMNQESAFLLHWPFASHGEIYDNIPDLHSDVDMPSSFCENRPESLFDLRVDRTEPFSSDIHQSTTGFTTCATTPLNEINETALGGSPAASQRTRNSVVQANTISPTSDDEVDVGILLANLQRDLSEQLVALESTPWDLATLSITSPETATTGSEKNLNLGFNPVALILASISQFTTILRRLNKLLLNPLKTVRKDHYQHHHAENQTHAGWSIPVPSQSPYRDSFALMDVSHPGSGATLPSYTVQDRVHLVTTINCYLLVLTILDTILSQLLSDPQEAKLQGSNNNVHSPSSLPSNYIQSSLQQNAVGPKLVFAGQSVALNARLRTRLLVQVVEHQLEILEQDLGLPQSFCVSSAHPEGPSHKSSGILSKRESLLLLRAVMGFTTNADGAGSSQHGEEPTRSPMTLSLSGKLKRALENQYP